jgi:hypothetical protein
LLHLLSLLVPDPTKDTVPVRRFQVRPLPTSHQIESFQASRPDLPQHRMERLPSPGFSSLPAVPPVAEVRPPGLPSIQPPPPAAVDGLELAGKPPVFKTAELALVDLDSMALEAVQQKAEEQRHYARLYLADADTSDAESRNRQRARQVVERAIKAMGGQEALLAITEMRVRVWIKADEHVVERPPLPP